MLAIPVDYIIHFGVILKVLSSKKALLSPEGFEKFCNHHLDEKFQNPKTVWNYHNTTVRCYKYITDVIRYLVISQIENDDKQNSYYF